MCKQIAEDNPQLGLSILTSSVGMVEQKLITDHFTASGNALLLSFHCQLGIERIEDTVFPYLQALMCFSCFAGCLSGTPGNALYLLGNQGENVICLDPHYVHETEGGLETYFKTHPRAIHYSKLVGSVCVNFLLKTKEEAEDFLSKLTKLNRKYGGITVLPLKKQDSFTLSTSDDSSDSEKSDDEDYELIS